MLLSSSLQQNTSQKQLTGERMYFGSLFPRTSLQGVRRCCHLWQCELREWVIHATEDR